MIILQILSIIYIFYFLDKTKLLINLDNKKKYVIYFLLILVGLSNTKVTIFNHSFDFLIIGIGVVLIEIVLKKLNTTINYLFIKIYFLILLVLILYRGGIWILQQL